MQTTDTSSFGMALCKRAKVLIPWLVLVQFFILAGMYHNSPGCERHAADTSHTADASWPVQADHSRRELRLGGRLRPARVFYNRVPKCGSSTLIELIRIMRKINNFTFSESEQYMMYMVDQQEQAEIVKNVGHVPAPAMFERHLHFVDFKRFGAATPIYINLVRDPLERLVSWYYYRRFQEGHRRVMSEEERQRTYNDCVLGNFSECVEPLGNDPERGYFKVIPFFCGQDKFCRVPGDDSLAQAIKNVKRHYALVGVLEEYGTFLRALEYTFPAFLRGLTEVNRAIGKKIRSKYATTNRAGPSAMVRALMGKRLADEYQFYHFIRRRFRRYASTIEAKKGHT